MKRKLWLALFITSALLRLQKNTFRLYKHDVSEQHIGSLAGLVILVTMSLSSPVLSDSLIPYDDNSWLVQTSSGEMHDYPLFQSGWSPNDACYFLFIVLDVKVFRDIENKDRKLLGQLCFESTDSSDLSALFMIEFQSAKGTPVSLSYCSKKNLIVVQKVLKKL